MGNLSQRAKFIRTLSLMVFIIPLLLHLPVFPAYSQRGDFAMMNAEPVQSAFGANVLAEGKQTVIKIDIASLFPEMPVVIRVSPFYEGYFSLSPEDYTVTVKPGLHSYYLPPFDLIPEGSEFCITVIVDPYDRIAEAFENDNTVKNSCFQIRNTEPLRVLYIPLEFENDEKDQLTQDEITAFAAVSNSFLKGTYPVAEDEFSYDILPFRLVISGYQNGDMSDPEAVALLNLIDGLRYILYGTYPGLPGSENVEDIQLVAFSRKGWFENFAGFASVGDEQNQIRAVLVDSSEFHGTTTAHEIAHTYGWVDEAHSNSLGHHLFSSAQGYWVQRNCEMGYWLYTHNWDPDTHKDIYRAICFEGETPMDFMYSGNLNPYFGNEEVSYGSIYEWISKPTFEYLLDKFSTNPTAQSVVQLTSNSTAKPVINIAGVVYSNGTGEILPWIKLSGTADLPLNNPGNLTISYMDSNGTQIAETGINVRFNNIMDSSRNSSNFGVISATIPDLHGAHKIAVKNGTTVLFERVVSASAPQVQLMTPNGGEVFNVGNNINVTWNISAQPNTKLTYAISLSQDNGETWIPLAMNLKNNSYDFELPMTVDNTRSALIKVSANDGINMVEDISDSTFTFNTTLVGRSLIR